MIPLMRGIYYIRLFIIFMYSYCLFKFNNNALYYTNKIKIIKKNPQKI